MVVFKPHIKHGIHNIIHIILVCTIFKLQFTLVNIYGLNIDEQAPFYVDLFNEIYSLPNGTKRRLQFGF